MVDVILLGILKTLTFVIQILPLEVGLAIARFLSFFVYLTHSRSQLAYANLKAAFGTKFTPKERKQIARKNLANLLQNAVEVLRIPKIDQKYFDHYIDWDHQERYVNAFKSRKGTVVITPHFGNWELTQVFSSILGDPLHVLAREQKHGRLNDFLNKVRASHGAVLIQTKGALRQLFKVLREGKTVGILGDLSGGKDGVVVRFFGRKTTAPPGIFEMAKRTGSVVIPSFEMRVNGPYHKVHVIDAFPIPETGDQEKDVETAVQNYYNLLETWITKYPEQWFWYYKRWKHCFTKKILILRDEKAGHRSQSEAVKREIENLKNSLPNNYEISFDSVDVKFKSSFHRQLFFAFAFFFQPFAQGRLATLKWFLEPNTAEQLANTYYDIIISTGSSLVPLNLLLKRENYAKSIVVMKPPFPYSAKSFDLSIVPIHDAFSEKARKTVRTLVAPNLVDEILLERSSQEITKKCSLNSTPKKRISVFIGGASKSYQFEFAHFEKWLKQLKAFVEEFDYEVLITTSRRTDSKLSDAIKSEFSNHPLCKLLVIANESNIENVTYGMLALSDISIVTEDSVSMISEAVSSGKKVLVLKLGNGKLREKHDRFHQALHSNQLVALAEIDGFEKSLSELSQNELKNSEVLKRQSQALQEALQKLL